jgi:ABC-type Fe3+ transport system substrate-binding protein
MKNKGLVLSLLVMTGGALLWTACQSGPKGGPAGAKLAIISPHTTDIRDNMMPLFQKWYQQKTGRTVEIEWINQGGSSDNLRFIKSEFSRTPAGIGIDVFWGGGVSPFFTLKQAGLLQKVDVDPAVLRPIPPEINGVPIVDPGHEWFGSCLSTFGIMTNEMVRAFHKFPAIRNWEDLTDPRLRGWISSADPRHSGTHHVAYGTILQAYGWEKGWRILTLMAANTKGFKISSKDVVKDLVAGDAAFTPSVDYYAWKEIERLGPDKISFLLPEGLSMINPDSFAMLKGAPHPEEGRLFIDYILSDAGQKAWMLKAGEPGGPPHSTLSRLAILPSVYREVQGKTLITINPFEKTSFIRYNVQEDEQLWDVFNDLMGTTLVDSHPALAAAWEKVIAGGLKPAAVAKLGEMPLTLEQAKEISGRWKNDKFRNETINQWLNFNQRKFDEAVRLSR